MKDYMDAPENSIEYYAINTTRPPMDDVRVRKAFNMAIDKEALATFRVVVKALTAFNPEGIFPGYPQPRGDGFNVARARELLAEAGYRDGSGNYDATLFPAGDVEICTTRSKQPPDCRIHPGAMETEPRDHGSAAQHGIQDLPVSEIRPGIQGFTRSGWNGDYMDPYTFLELFATLRGTTDGMVRPRLRPMLEEANRTMDH